LRKQKNLTRKVECLAGSYFGEETIVKALLPDLIELHQIRSNQFYEVSCASFDAEILLFESWHVQACLKAEPSAVKKMCLAYRQKIPRLLDYKPNYIDNYNSVLDDTKLQQECY